MKKVLILGATGMLGSQVLDIFLKDKKFKISATYRNKQNLNKLLQKNKKFYEKVKFIKFDVENFTDKKLSSITKSNEFIINCIGLIKPYIDEKNKDYYKATLINIIFPSRLSKFCKKKNKMFQIATDCVYSGNKKNYNENDLHDAKDIYGKTKSLGEINKKNFFNLRCSIIGEEILHKKSLLEWFKNLEEGSKVTGFLNHEWNGVSTKVFAELLKTIILKKIKLPNLLHIVPKNSVNKYQLLRLFSQRFSRNDVVIKKGKSTLAVNRTLSTINKKINLEIWNKSVYKKILNIKDIVENI